MRVALDLRKSVEENAQRYFEAAKKARRKAAGAAKAIERLRAAPKTGAEAAAPRVRAAPRKREWFERFRWFVSSDGVLVVGGRDASTNESVIKKHAAPKDVVFHTDMAGSPFVVVQAGGEAVPVSTMGEAAQFCASYSRAWRNGFSSLEVFHVAPEQVSKEAQAGEHLAKGAFMVRGRTTYLKPLLEVAVGLDAAGRVMAGPPSAIKKHCVKAVRVVQGNGKASAVAAELKRLLGGGSADEFVAALPPGGCALEK